MHLLPENERCASEMSLDGYIRAFRHADDSVNEVFEDFDR